MITKPPGARWARIRNWLWGIGIVLLFLIAQTWNAAMVLTPDGIHYVDADCYSRMTRVKMIQANPIQLRIAANDFENYPDGTHPHTTAPMDYTIAALAVFTDRDHAGAYISPLLGALALLMIWILAQRLQLPYRHALTLLFAVSPILAHGFALGRPDHQSLLLLLVALGLLAEIGRERSAKWNVVWGIAWGLALWTSLFEPLILFAAILLIRSGFYLGRKIWPRASIFGAAPPPSRSAWIALGCVIGVALIVDGIRLPQIDPAHTQLLRNWASTISELRGASLQLLFSWVGWTLPLVGIGLILATVRGNSSALRFFILLTGVTVLSLIHSRWGYFFALIFCLSLPFAFGWIRQRWLVYPLFLVSLWPVATVWDSRFFPNETTLRTRQENYADFADLQFVIDKLAELPPDGGVLAPWWRSPALAYESGWPMVSGSSHEGIAGIADSARFYLAADPLTAREILAKRNVRYVVTYDAERLDLNSSFILGRRPAGPTTAQHLAKTSQDFLPELTLVLARGPYRLYEVPKK